MTEHSNPTPGYVLVLTEHQLWFIERAIDVRGFVLPIYERQLDPKTFEEDYGISQEDMRAEVASLSDKVKQLKP
jgi:hypothetical protein